MTQAVSWTASGTYAVTLRVKDNLSRHNTSLIAASIAFYVFLAIPSAITALVSLYGLAFDPTNANQIWAACATQHDLPHEKDLDEDFSQKDGGVMSSMTFTSSSARSLVASVGKARGRRRACSAIASASRALP